MSTGAGFVALSEVHLPVIASDSQNGMATSSLTIGLFQQLQSNRFLLSQINGCLE
jgi:hypothetical protein